MEQVTKLLEQLAQKLGTTVQLLWGVLIKQQYADALTALTVGIIFGIISIICYKKLPPIINKLDKKESWGNLFDTSPYKYWWVMYWILQGVLLLVVLLTLLNGIKILYNPEYYALQEILKAL